MRFVFVRVVHISCSLLKINFDFVRIENIYVPCARCLLSSVSARALVSSTAVVVLLLLLSSSSRFNNALESDGKRSNATRTADPAEPGRLRDFRTRKPSPHAFYVVPDETDGRVFAGRSRVRRGAERTSVLRSFIALLLAHSHDDGARTYSPRRPGWY